MGLKETFEAAAKTAIQAAGNIAVSTNYQSYASTVYNASAGTQTASYSTVGGVSIIFDKFTFEQVDGEQIRPEDKKALVASKLVSTITPKVSDRIVAGGIVWNVVAVKTDPAEALYELQVRKS